MVLAGAGAGAAELVITNMSITPEGDKMGKWLAGIIGTVIAGVLVYWLTVGIHSPSIPKKITQQPPPHIYDTPVIIPKPTLYQNVINTSYEVECRDNEYGNIFTAIIKFPNKNSAHWRYTDSTNWNDSLKVEYLSPHKLLLTLGVIDESRTTWELNLSEGFEKIKGSYKFLQKNPSRWRNYVVNGYRLQ